MESPESMTPGSGAEKKKSNLSKDDSAFRDLLAAADPEAAKAFDIGTATQEEREAEKKRKAELDGHKEEEMAADSPESNEDIVKHYNKTVNDILENAKRMIRKDSNMNEGLSDIEWLRVDAIMEDIMETKKRSQDEIWKKRFNELFSAMDSAGMDKFKSIIKEDLIARTEERAMKEISNGKTFH